VKCPKCNTVFPVAAPATPAFEVVDETPPKPAAPAPKPAPAVAKSTPKPVAPVENDFEFDDEKPKKKKRDDDDDDDDRPRGKKKSRRDDDDDDDDDDDRPRSKKKRSRDDDDDDDDRPRGKKKSRRDDDDDDDEDDRPRSKKKRSRDDDDDDDDDRPRGKKKRRRDDDDDDDDWHDAPSRKSNGFGNAKTGVLLLNISFWLYMSSLAIITLMILLGWVAVDSMTGGGGRGSRGGSSSDGEWFFTLLMLPGLLGLGNWIVATIGFAFCIGGPQKARGLAITSTVFAGVHLVLIMLTFTTVRSSMGVLPMGGDAMSWPMVATILPVLDMILPSFLIPGTRVSGMIGSGVIFAVLGAVCELLRLIFGMMLVKELATAAKDYDSAEKAQMGMVGSYVIVGGSALIVFLLALMARAGVGMGMNAFIGVFMLIYLGLTAMTVMPLMATSGARSSLARKAR